MALQLCFHPDPKIFLTANFVLSLCSYYLFMTYFIIPQGCREARKPSSCNLWAVGNNGFIADFSGFKPFINILNKTFEYTKFLVQVRKIYWDF